MCNWNNIHVLGIATMLSLWGKRVDIVIFVYSLIVLLAIKGTSCGKRLRLTTSQEFITIAEGDHD